MAIAVCVAILTRTAPAAEQFDFHLDHVLGTSMDLVVMADSQEAANKAEQAISAEVERLRKILSTYDPASEISRLRPNVATHCSRELIEVLDACQTWHDRSGGAFNAQLGILIKLWQTAAKRDRVPDAAELADVVKKVNQPAWRTHASAGTVTRLNDLPLNVDALAKGYILDKSLATAKGIAGVHGALLDIGGEVSVFGQGPGGQWRVGVADPAHHADNARPMQLIKLDGRSVATSAAYDRYYTIGGKHYSHIFDPHTGKSAEGVASASVIASNCTDADALATILCVLEPRAGIRLVESLRDKGMAVDCLLVLPDGTQMTTPGWKDGVIPQPLAMPTTNPNWPKGFELTINLAIVAQSGRGHRPYVAVWIENAKGDPVRTIQVWGREQKYLRDLPRWWAFARNKQSMVQTVTRASRGPGKYQLTWDGNDDSGKPVPAGAYTVRIESNREKGTHVFMSGKIECAAKPAEAKMDDTREIEGVTLKFAAKEAKP